MGETPLGHTVRIRSEKDPKVIAKMTPEQKKIRADWQIFKASMVKMNFDEKTERERMNELERMIKAAFGGKEG